jgi:BirA family biotin operon repressor/biotin-[acetyl-CoA-carboxylase] ligase
VGHGSKGDGVLDLERFAARLGTQTYGRTSEILASTASTNDDARVEAVRGARRGHVVVADHQTAGRGARGHLWSSPPGTDLYFSVVERGLPSVRTRPPLTLAVGLGIAQAVERLIGAEDSARVRIKWPNDVVVDGKKCSGVLVESSSGGHVDDVAVLGVGVNVNRTDFDPDLRERATSLALVTGHRWDRGEVLAALLAGIETQVDRFLAEGPEPITADVSKRLFRRGETVPIDGSPAELVAVSSTGALLVRRGGAIEELTSGELDAYGR